MSGHSKWAKIKRAKGATDAARGALFTKLSQAITLAAQEGGGDPNFNFILRLAIDKAKQANMPSDNIDRAVKKGTGELKSEKIEKITYEGFAPHNVAMLIDTQTDNSNRTVSNVRNSVEVYGGKLASAGSVAWQFEEKGLVVVEAAKFKKSEKYGQADSYEKADREAISLEILGIDGVEDIQEESGEDEDGKAIELLEVYCSKNDLAKVRESIEKLNLKIDSADIVKIAKEKVSLDDAQKEKLRNFIEHIEELDDVQSVWVNADIY